MERGEIRMNYQEYCKEVGLNVSQHFTEKISDSYGATRVSSNKHRLPIEFIVLHTTANNASAINEAKNIANNSGINSFNVVADEIGVVETVKFSNVSHHAGNKDVNRKSIGFELCETNGINEGYENLVKYVAWVLYQLGLTPSTKTVRLHNEFVSTSCGGYYKKKELGNVIQDIIKYFAIAKGTNDTVTDKPQAAKASRVGQVLVVRDSYPKAKFTAYYDKECTKPVDHWTIANYDFNLTFGIVEDHDPIFKCVQWSLTPMSGVDHVYIKWEPGIGFDVV